MKGRDNEGYSIMRGNGSNFALEYEFRTRNARNSRKYTYLVLGV